LTPSLPSDLLVSAIRNTGGCARAPAANRRVAFDNDEFQMKSIGKYQVIEDLGASATGNTYRARDAFRNREFSVKILKTVPNLSAQAKESFCEYLGSCAELTHRHISKIHDLGEVEEGIFVATDWRSGTDLRRFMEQNRDLPLDQKLGVIAQVAEGLAFAHSRGIAHGNLKPSNIFVDAARDASILDFGIAKWLAALLDVGSRPEGLVANYLAPEQVLGQPFDARSDLFALGLMLYEFASGQYPFSGDAGLIPREIVHTQPEPLRKLNAQAPEELEELLARALHKNPEERLQTAEEFASGLYLAAQQLRRAAAPPEPAAGPASSDGLVEQLPGALSPAFAAPVQAAPLVLEMPALEIPVKPRERPQSAEPESRPWTARSYASAQLNSAQLTKDLPPARPTAPVLSAELPKPGTARVHRPPPPPPSTPAFEPPQSFLKPDPLPPPPVQRKPGGLSKGVLTAVAGLVAAAVIVGSLVSRQNLKASQSRIHAVAPVTEPAAPVLKPAVPHAPAPAPEVRAPKHEDTDPDVAVNPEVSAKQILNGPVRTLWESGRYAQAMALVNRVLTSDPTNDDARSWKKKIREAQAAEAALK
jgi:eukaryotic-like serine/threonine-protein kinase